MKDAFARALLASVLTTSLALQRNSNVGTGRLPLVDDDSAVDAYIEKLIKSVDEEADNEDGPVESTVPNEVKEHGVDLEFEDSAAAESVVAKEDSPKTTIVPIEKGVLRKSNNTTKKKRTHGKKRKKPRNTEGIEINTSESAERTTGDLKDKPSLPTATDQLGSIPKKTTESMLPSESSKPNPAVEPRSRIPPPNGLYRFFLGKGLVGRLLVMFFILISELISVLIPSVGKVFQTILPRPIHVNVDNRRRPSKKKQSEMTREADQAALQQLQKAGKDGGKYRLIVSSEFLKRHEIGEFSIEHSDAGAALDRTNANSDDQLNDEEEEDIGWIIEALSPEKQNVDDDHPDSVVSDHGHNPTRPADSVGKRRKSNSQRDSIRAAIKIPKKKSKKRMSLGSKLMEKFSSTDSRFSRNILGAYPGDAPTLEEAANPSGLLDLARKYGWGEWSIKDERRKRRRRSFHDDSASFGIDLGRSSIDTDEFDDPLYSEVRAIRRSRHLNFQSDDNTDEEGSDASFDDGHNPLDHSKTIPGEEATNNYQIFTGSRGKPVRPATDLLAERRKLRKDM